jgi:hypothetical protein
MQGLAKQFKLSRASKRRMRIKTVSAAGYKDSISGGWLSIPLPREAAAVTRRPVRREFTAYVLAGASLTLGWLSIPHATERAVIAACRPAFRNGATSSTTSDAGASCSVESHCRNSCITPLYITPLCPFGYIHIMADSLSCSSCRDTGVPS